MLECSEPSDSNLLVSASSLARSLTGVLSRTSCIFARNNSVRLFSSAKSAAVNVILRRVSGVIGREFEREAEREPAGELSRLPLASDIPSRFWHTIRQHL